MFRIRKFLYRKPAGLSRWIPKKRNERSILYRFKRKVVKFTTISVDIDSVRAEAIDGRPAMPLLRMHTCGGFSFSWGPR